MASTLKRNNNIAFLHFCASQIRKIQESISLNIPETSGQSINQNGCLCSLTLGDSRNLSAPLAKFFVLKQYTRQRFPSALNSRNSRIKTQKIHIKMQKPPLKNLVRATTPLARKLSRAALTPPCQTAPPVNPARPLSDRPSVRPPALSDRPLLSDGPPLGLRCELTG